ncbi:carbonic anhydrase family protein [Pannus brasiliensis CCIBt3594]|uniref:Carbonic anhydrase n=1 Tax=Pannus brasiliensis CCIBt3594 TaxID=1427578 RepID=A0AAW9QT54_9CHRO
MERRPLLRFLGSNALVAAIAPAVNWDYPSAAAPENWGEISPDFQRCATGSRQSPIDLDFPTATESNLLTIDYRSTPLTLTNTGRTIRVRPGVENSIAFRGETFRLQQFHFHHPSEHRIAGRRFEMEIHFLHVSDRGNIAVIAVLARSGTSNPRLQPIFNNIPRESGANRKIADLIDIERILPEKRDFYEYRGSLTTPPCSEGVLWFVLENPIEVSPSEIRQFTDIIPFNARSIRPAGDRPILHS